MYKIPCKRLSFTKKECLEKRLCYGKEEKKEAENFSFKLCEDIYFHIISFLGQTDLICFGQTCKYFRKIQSQAYHFDKYMIFNCKMVPFIKHHPIKSIAIHGVKDLQLVFPDLPVYTYIGFYSSFHPSNTYRGIIFGPPQIMCYPKVKTLFIEEAPVSINFSCFPNLEELFIKTTQIDLQLEGIDQCKKLKKIIVYIEKGIIYLSESKIMDLPLLEVFCVTGNIQGREFTPVSPFLKHFVFYTLPNRLINDVYYEKVSENPDRTKTIFQELFRHYHQSPIDIRDIGSLHIYY